MQPQSQASSSLLNGLPTEHRMTSLPASQSGGGGGGGILIDFDPLATIPPAQPPTTVTVK